MADRSVKVTLSASTEAFDRAMKQSAAAASQLKDELSSTGDGMGNATKSTQDMAAQLRGLPNLTRQANIEIGRSGTVMQRLAATAREVADASQTQEWSTVGNNLAVAGAAGLVLAGAVAKTGIEYNVLQSTSRAAMSTLLGGAEAANAQMDKLDAFARTSPFSKAVFIEAQQQMIGFGIETEKVIPYLGAIQDTTAAIGGNNQTISEISLIMSQISASSKITATDLMQFGQRGIDAATLIGSQMGMTGAEIREQITAGTLDAGQALDALAAGMTERFGGAAANVKDTFVGAVDRVKAAFRDLTADIMSSAVGPEGGGWLVDMTNKFADFIRLVDKVPTPIKETGFALGAMGSAGLLAVGGTMKLTTEAVKLHRSFADLATSSPRVYDGLTKGGGAAAGAAIAFAALHLAATAALDKWGTAAPGIEYVTSALEGLGEGAASAQNRLDRVFQNADGSGGIIGGVDNFRDALQKLRAVEDQPWGQGAAYWMENVIAQIVTLGKHEGQIERLRGQFAAFDQELSGMDFSSATDSFRELSQMLVDEGYSWDEITAMFPEYAARITNALVDASDETHSFAVNSQMVADVMRGDLPDGMVDVEGKLMTVAAAAELAADATDDLSDGATTLDENLQAVVAASDAAQAAMDRVVQSMWDASSAIVSTSNAEIRLEESFARASKTIEENGRNLDINTEKGRENQKALNDIVTSAIGYAQAAYAQGESIDVVNTKLDRARDQYVRTAQAAGDSRSEAELLTEAMELIPESVETLVAVPGATLSIQEARDLNDSLRGLPDDVKSTVITIANLSGYNAAMAALREAQGKSVNSYINVVTRSVGSAPALGAPTLRATGGPIFGPGTATSDSIPVMASDGEFMLRTWAAKRIGYDVLDFINRTGQLPQHRADGGRVASETYRYTPPPPAVYRPHINVNTPTTQQGGRAPLQVTVNAPRDAFRDVDHFMRLMGDLETRATTGGY